MQSTHSEKLLLLCFTLSKSSKIVLCYFCMFFVLFMWIKFLYSPFCCPFVVLQTEIVFFQWLIFVQLVMSLKCFFFTCAGLNYFILKMSFDDLVRGQWKWPILGKSKGTLWKDACANPDTSQSTNFADH